jgi:transketolase N-terminal domain/subunit
VNPTSTLADLCINTIRTLSIDGVQKANSGHPGMPMGAATMAYVLWTRHLRYNPANPAWPDRDRFVLSAGHASMLLYSMLHLTGYDVTLDDLKQFRRWGSRTPGHPERNHTPGVEVTTGPLGQGFGNGVGLAMAERWLAASFNRVDHTVVDHSTYVLASDGDLMEGISAEAASLAGDLRLGRLIVLYDSNRVTLSATTDITFREDVGARFAAYGWHVQHVDGLDVDAVDAALTAARADDDRPSLIIASTHIGFGSPNKQDTFHAHGEPLGVDEVKLTKQAYGWPRDATFLIPDEALAEFRKAVANGAALETSWEHRMNAFRAAHADTAAAFDRGVAGGLPDGWEKVLPTFTAADGAMATRDAGGKVIAALCDVVPNLVGGSADLDPSTKTAMKAAHAGTGRRRVGVRGTQHPFRDSRARHDGGAHGDGAPRWRAPIWRDISHVLGLHAAEYPARRAERRARDLRLDTRQHCARRGWTDAPAGGTAGKSSRHAEHAGPAACRRNGNRRGVAYRAPAHSGSGGTGAHAPGTARTGSHGTCPRVGRRARGLRVERYIRGVAERDPHRHGFRGVARVEGTPTVDC